MQEASPGEPRTERRGGGESQARGSGWGGSDSFQNHRLGRMGGQAMPGLPEAVEGWEERATGGRQSPPSPSYPLAVLFGREPSKDLKSRTLCRPDGVLQSGVPVVTSIHRVNISNC